MSNKSSFMAGLILLVYSALLVSSKAYAHFPTLSCKVEPKDKTKLYCLAGYSDASVAGVVKLKLYSYDDELIENLSTVSDGSVSFNLPQGEYYIVFDPGHESPAEFDYAELE